MSGTTIADVTPGASIAPYSCGRPVSSTSAIPVRANAGGGAARGAGARPAAVAGGGVALAVGVRRRDVADLVAGGGDVDRAEIRHLRDDEPRDRPERRLVVERAGEDLAALGEEALAALPAAALCDVLEDQQHEAQVAVGAADGARLDEDPPVEAGLDGLEAHEAVRRGLAAQHPGARQVAGLDQAAGLVVEPDPAADVAQRGAAQRPGGRPAQQRRGRLVGVDDVAAHIAREHAVGDPAEDRPELVVRAPQRLLARLKLEVQTRLVDRGRALGRELPGEREAGAPRPGRALGRAERQGPDRLLAGAKRQDDGL